MELVMISQWMGRLILDELHNNHLLRNRTLHYALIVQMQKRLLKRKVKIVTDFSWHIKLIL